MMGWQMDFYENWLPRSGHKILNSKGYGVVVYEKGRFFGLDDKDLDTSEVDVMVPLYEHEATFDN